MSVRAPRFAPALLAVSLLFSPFALADAHDASGAAGSSARRTADSETPFFAQVLNGSFSNFPEVVRLSNGRGLCSGTFVSTRVIVTAAHCLPGRTGTLSVRGNAGPLGNARCEKSPRAGEPPVRAQSNSSGLQAQCGGRASGVCGAGGINGVGGLVDASGAIFDPNFPGGIAGFPGNPGDFVRGIPGFGDRLGSIVDRDGRRRIPDGSISVQDIQNDIAVCVVDSPVDEAETACLDASNATPSEMMIVGFGLANRGNAIVDDNRQRSGTFPVRRGPADGILETRSEDLSSGPNASSAPGDSGGFVGVRDNRGRLKLRAVVSGGDAIIDGRELARAPGPNLNPENRGVSAFVDLQSANSLEFLRDFAKRNGVSICGLDSASSGSGGQLASASGNASDVRPTGGSSIPIGSPVASIGGFPGKGFGIDGLNNGFGVGGLNNFGVGGFGGVNGLGGFGGIGFGGFNPGEQGVVNPAAGGLGLGVGNNGFGNPFFGGARLVRLRSGRLALVSSGFGGFRRGFFPGFGRRGGFFFPRRSLRFASARFR